MNYLKLALEVVTSNYNQIFSWSVIDLQYENQPINTRQDHIELYEMMCNQFIYWSVFSLKLETYVGWTEFVSESATLKTWQWSVQ